MELPCESLATNRASNDVVAMDTGLGIIDDPEILPTTNQTSLESDVTAFRTPVQFVLLILCFPKCQVVPNLL
jgi:hypothetical protein